MIIQCKFPKNKITKANSLAPVAPTTNEASAAAAFTRNRTEDNLAQFLFSVSFLVK